jgi:acetyl-CoA acetyltransferase family protein
VDAAYIVDLVRSPFGRGRRSGLLADVHPVDLLAQVLAALMARVPMLDAAAIDDLLCGCVLQVGEQSGNIGRHAWLAAGLPDSVPAVTLDRKCASSQQALHFAAHEVACGASELVVVAGVDMLGRVPMKANRLDADELGPMLRRRYPQGLPHQAAAAERIAQRWGLDRPQLDAYALRSHRLAAAAEDAGTTTKRLVPIATRGAHATRDEGVRRNSTLAQLAALVPVTREMAEMSRFGIVDATVTAGNASQVSDGACAALVASERALRTHGLTPMARIAHTAAAAADPQWVLTAVLPATATVLRKSGRSIVQVDAFEVNEAFASVVLAWQQEFGAEPERVNRAGGAIAIGHPPGASGLRLAGNLIDVLAERGQRWGLQAMCASGGLGCATLIERC